MKRSLLAGFFYSAVVVAAQAGTCATGALDSNMPGGVSSEAEKRIEAVFPTYRQLVLSSDSSALLWIDPRDCAAPDLDARAAEVERALSRKVTLIEATENFRVIPAYRYPEVTTTRQLKQLYPSLTLRGNKIGANVEVLVVAASDFQAPDADARRAKAAAIVGRPVELQMQR
ncbi:hypothetical protein TB15x_20610 [Xanthomonas perforans]|uniref:hypothetical protein n=1 Tax=Xanthomonas perforans TaxID=442694 RepID=UPI00062D0CE6|nr:hypothetical protein [Xanthomonas perforans]KLD35823.1 hypothetical protein TB15x_20610 [Xanthomonas perforans]MBZ2436254.1 hypothetical protein [Xanthomonas perforans]MBZ2461366.1 hypothetical protein [Xanthomonas perforans]MBZ2482792.1 hypothetical protein [Xanthomonas perforans]MBZ2491360.1 hypothetical protein [Xanthomonas perforans]